MPTATRPGNSRAALLTKAGSLSAAVPRMTRAIPAPSQRAMAWRSRTPPPSCTGTVAAPRMDKMALSLTAFPAIAPSRSTMCNHFAPAAAKARACAAGSALNTVALSMSPRKRRTHFPPLRSMAG